MTLDLSRKYVATFTTTNGTFSVALLPDSASEAVNNFVFLADDHFYDGMDFFNISTQAIESGDPWSLGSGGPGYTIKTDPVPANLDYEPYTLVMGTEGKATSGSRFGILVADQRGKYDKKYPIFGKVTSGMDVVDRIATWRANESLEPRPLIISVTVQVS